MHIAGAGGSVTHTLRARAVMVRKSAGAGRSGMKKTVPRRSLVETRLGISHTSLDLKDAYFHVPVRQAFRKFLRFAFMGVAYE